MRIAIDPAAGMPDRLVPACCFEGHADLAWREYDLDEVAPVQAPVILAELHVRSNGANVISSAAYAALVR
jgi:hypothetical protein